MVAGSLCLALAGCGGAPQERASADDANAANAPQTAFAWTSDADCSPCHAAQSSSLADAACQIAANHADVACAECHTDEAGLAAAHADVAIADTKGVKKLSETSVEQAACAACHVDAGAPEAAADSIVLTDDRGTMVNPHDLPDSASHATLTCGSCHTMHDDRPLEETAPAACVQCHHQNVYECYTCHE